MKEPLINVAVVDDHAMFRAGIINLLDEHEEINVLFDAKEGADLQKKIKQYGTPEVVLMDVSMPIMDGCEATLWLKQTYPQVHVLALSMDDQEAKVIRMIRYGAGGYLLKTSTIDELVKGILIIAATGSYINEYVSGRLLNAVRNGNIDKEISNQLTNREKEFLFYCCSELNYKEIALKMNISTNTVNNYRDVLGEKLNVRSRVGLVLYVIKNGIVKVEDL